MPRELIPVNLPVYHQCICVPVQWGVTISPSLDKVNPHVLSVGTGKEAKGTLFDPREKRNEFLRLPEGDARGLLKFLNSVGLFQRSAPPSEFDWIQSVTVRGQDGFAFRVDYDVETDARWMWVVRRAISESLREGKSTIEAADMADFNVRFTRYRGEPCVLLTTATFLDALLLTLEIDRIRGAKIRKCARPDCGIVFSNSGGHEKKYCERYCAHIESVRRDRKRAKQKGR